MEFNEGLFTEDLAGIGNPTRDRSVQGPAITTPFSSRDLLVRAIATVGRGAAQQELQPYLKTQPLPKSASNREGVEEETMNTGPSPSPPFLSGAFHWLNTTGSQRTREPR